MGLSLPFRGAMLTLAFHQGGGDSGRLRKIGGSMLGVLCLFCSVEAGFLFLLASDNAASLGESRCCTAETCGFFIVEYGNGGKLARFWNLFLSFERRYGSLVSSTASELLARGEVFDAMSELIPPPPPGDPCRPSVPFDTKNELSPQDLVLT